MSELAEKSEAELGYLFWELIAKEIAQGRGLGKAVNMMECEMLIPGDLEKVLDSPVSEEALNLLYLFVKADFPSQYGSLRRHTDRKKILKGYSTGREIWSHESGASLLLFTGERDKNPFEESMILFRRLRNEMHGMAELDAVKVFIPDSRSGFSGVSYSKEQMKINRFTWDEVSADSQPVAGVSRRFFFVFLAEMMRSLTEDDRDVYDKRTLQHIFDLEVKAARNELSFLDKTGVFRPVLLAVLLAVGAAGGTLAVQALVDEGVIPVPEWASNLLE